jgi:inositol oxygenase
MVHAPEITEFVKAAATKLDAVSDNIDDVNKLKGKEEIAFDADSKFDAEHDKGNFRRYEEACDRVKNFYAVSIEYCAPHSAVNGS